MMTGTNDIRFVIYAPDRMGSGGPETVMGPYLAMRAAFMTATYGKFQDGSNVSDRVQSIACPPLGVGVVLIALVRARQMITAIIAAGRPGYMPDSDGAALKRQMELSGAGPHDESKV